MTTNSKCKICGKRYSMGDNGAVDGCDACLGVERDRNGYAWLPDEQEHVYYIVKTGKFETVTRAEAFGKVRR